MILLDCMKYAEAQNYPIYYLLTLKQRDLFLSAVRCVIKGYEIMRERYRSKGQTKRTHNICYGNNSVPPFTDKKQWRVLFNFHVIIRAHRVT